MWKMGLQISTCSPCVSPRTGRRHFHPKRIILMRHGQSLGNVDETAYGTIPDWKIPLTLTGRSQACAAGVKIKNIIGDEPLAIYCSPYLRTKQTLAEVMPTLQNNPLVAVREEPRMTEQQFGNYQGTDEMKAYKKERNKFGRFYYRFPEGESGLDVYNRVSLFIGTLHREWERDTAIPQSGTNVLIITHGLTLRLFLMKWFHLTVEEFERSANPDNCAVVEMIPVHPRSHSFTMDEQSQQVMKMSLRFPYASTVDDYVNECGNEASVGYSGPGVCGGVSEACTRESDGIHDATAKHVMDVLLAEAAAGREVDQTLKLEWLALLQ